MKTPYIVSQIEQLPIDCVIASSTNPRTHTQQQVQLVADRRAQRRAAGRTLPPAPVSGSHRDLQAQK